MCLISFTHINLIEGLIFTTIARRQPHDRTGTIKKHLKLYADHAVQSHFLGKPLAYLQTKIGSVNSYMHIWVYASATDREAKRQALRKNAA